MIRAYKVIEEPASKTLGPMMFRTFSILIGTVIGISFAIPDVPVLKQFAGIVEAGAQQKKPKTLFDILFKRKNRNTTAKRRLRRNHLDDLPGVQRFTRQGTRTDTVALARTATEPERVVVKNENAGKILVVGDFMASGLARGLERFYLENPNVVIVNRANASSGIVRDDVVNWPVAVGTMIQEINPIAVVYLAGLNDRQAIRTQTGSVKKLSDEWLAEYKKRSEAFVAAVRGAGKPLVWIGIPPVKSGAMNTDYLVFNEVYREAIEASGEGYVDVWDGFTNADGKYVTAGPDINGQIVRLRTNKGISMTRAGREKLAFFADKVLKRMGIVGSANGNDFASLGTINIGNAQPQIPEYDPIGTGKTIVISLGSPVSDGGNVLEGETDFLLDDDNQKSVSYALVEKGMIAKPREGRVDGNWGLPSANPGVVKTDVSGNEEPKQIIKIDGNTPDIIIEDLSKLTNIRQAAQN